jgi:hypothetical protein
MGTQLTTGALKPWSAWGDYDGVIFAVRQALNKMQTATLVQIVAVTNDGGVSPIGTVDVMPLVNQVDSLGIPTPHGTVFGISYLRIQGGSNAVIVDPQVGDIGVAVFCSRDISKVKSTQQQANPGSNRKYSFADGIYLSTVLSASAPTQYLQFNADGISLVTPQDLDATASGDVNITASGDTDITASGTLTLSGDSIQAGSSPVPVVSRPFVTWVNSTLLPALAAHGITVTAPPADALTSTFEAS